MQEEQVDCIHPVHFPDPPMGLEMPSEFLDKEVNVERSFCPRVLQVGQEASSLT